ncbi:ATPase, T2SS/T4P/T4SS family [Brevibacillus centrosporus]|uniref:ATPase, T2SS/T4P/T4SS family n=1 Tax=Brevibacillus centrosporus TaxID=54910 RepID=UPI003D194384
MAAPTQKLGGQSRLRRNRVDSLQFTYEEKKHKSSQSQGILLEQSPEERAIAKVRNYLSRFHTDTFNDAILNPKARSQIRQEIRSFIHREDIVLPNFNEDEAVDYLLYQITGLGKAQEDADDPDVNEIQLDPDGRIWIRKGKDEYVKKDGNGRPIIMSEAERFEIASRIKNARGGKLDLAKPYLDTATDTNRINIIINPFSPDGTAITLRRFTDFLRITEEGFVSSGQGTELMLHDLKLNMRLKVGSQMIAGPTGSGKTELFKFLVKYLPDDKRTLLVEDTRESRLKVLFPQKRILELLTRHSDDPRISIDLSKALLNALRLTPDRIMVQEVRDKALRTVLEIFMTGHPGMTTAHAESAEDMFERAIMMVIEAVPNLPPQIIGRWIAKALGRIVVQKRYPDGVFRISEIVEVQGYDIHNFAPILNPIFKYKVLNYKYAPGVTFDEKGNPMNIQVVDQVIGYHEQIGRYSRELTQRMIEAGATIEELQDLGDEELLAEIEADLKRFQRRGEE